MFKRLFSGSNDDSSKGTPLLSDDENQTKVDGLTGILSVEEIQALPPGSFAERMRNIRHQAELSNTAKTKLIAEKLIEPNLLFETKLRQESVAYFIQSIQEWNAKTAALAFHFDYYRQSTADRIHPLGKLIDRITEYRNKHAISNIPLFNSLIADHLRAVSNLLMTEVSEITGFKVCDKDERIPATVYIEETKTEFVIGIRWAQKLS
jgi:hypothetical protein